MPRLTLPSGRYLNCPVDLSPNAGGQTRAMLNRNRLFVTEAGVHPSILTFNARTDWAERRRVLLERGLLLDEIATPNIYEHYREHGWGDSDDQPQPERELPDVSHLQAEQHSYEDGRPWRTVYRSGQRVVLYDYLRDDGTPYLRIPNFVFKEPSTWPTGILRVSPQGRVEGQFTGLGGWFRRFVRDLSEGERSFVFIDSRHSAPHLIPMHAPHIHLVYVLHNIHVSPPRRWSSEHNAMYSQLMRRLGGLDAFVTLTQRQQDDVAQRRGRTSNMFVVPNPVDIPEHEGPLPERDPRQATVVARIELQKRLRHTVMAFAKVLERLPDARLDIYGSGSRVEELRQVIDNQRVGHAVTLRGHDPRAREALWRSSVFMMTSSFEGYPLSTLESLSHGCPVVAYDIKYGPREQITDGEDGFVVPAGDIDGVADRVVRLMESPDLVRRMSEAAVEKARQHGPDRFLRDWQQVLDRVVEQKPFRTRIDDVTLQVDRLTLRPARRAGRRGRPIAGSVRVDPGARLDFAGSLRLTGHSRRSEVDSAEVTLSAVQHDVGHAVALPLTVRRSGDVFSLRSTVRLADAFGAAEHLAGVRLRLRVVWQNSSWETNLSRPDGDGPSVEVGFAADRSLALSLE